MTPVPPSGKIYVAVAAGSALGAVGRYATALAALHLAGEGFPWGTLAANALGSLIIGFYATLTEPGGRVFASPAARQFVMAGVLGGFTTFSIFSLEAVILVVEGRARLGAATVAASLLLWIPAAWVGHALAQRLNRLRRTEP